MTTQEFSNEFDVLYNNIMSNQAPGLDEYEKSVFLTKAQNEILKNYFNPKGNKYQEGFDGSAKRQIDFSNLIKVLNSSKINLEGLAIKKLYPKVDSRSQIFEFPSGSALLIISESCTVQVSESNSDKKILCNVVPINFQEYQRLITKPYKYPTKNQVWRIIESNQLSNALTGASTTGLYAELIKDKPIVSYTIRYLKKPNPIILTNLADNYSDVTIEGKTAITECELDSLIHPEILQRAVELAKAAYTGDLNSSIEMGKRSE